MKNTETNHLLKLNAKPQDVFNITHLIADSPMHSILAYAPLNLKTGGK